MDDDDSDNVSDAGADFAWTRGFNKDVEEGSRDTTVTLISAYYSLNESCRANGGTWKDVYQYIEKDTKLPKKSICESRENRVWGTPRDALSPEQEECLVVPPKLVCQKAPHTRTNHLGKCLEFNDKKAK